MRRSFVAVLVVLLCAGSSAALAVGPPVYETRVLQPVGDQIAGPAGDAARNTLGAVGSRIPVDGPHGEVHALIGQAGRVFDSGACTDDTTWEVRPPKPNEVHGDTYANNPACRRLRVVFGPIMNKPGQDDVLIQPVTFEKPLYDGYLVRFKPGLVDENGVTPPVEQTHLHHGTWLNTTPSYGNGPWIATGEEKTIASWPFGYGLHIGQADNWLFLHMVHNATETPFPVWVTYDLDFVATSGLSTLTDGDGNHVDMKPTRGIWMDDGGSKFNDKTETYTLNPIFNIQKGFGVNHVPSLVDDGTGHFAAPPPTLLPDPRVAPPGHLVCYFPRENCAGFNSNGHVSAQQGIDTSGVADSNGAGRGMDLKVGDSILGSGVDEGKLVIMGGHVHNGGLGTLVELVRGDQSRVINISEAYYWQDDPYTDRIGNSPASWDYSQTGSTLDHGWSVDVHRGDILRLNGVYDTSLGSWYEQMGIVMSWIAPGDTTGKDVFALSTTIDPNIPRAAKVPNDAAGNPLSKTCDGFSPTVLCLRGQVTHGQIETSGNHLKDGELAPYFVDWKAAPPSPVHLNDFLIGGFTYGLADQTVAQAVGVPTIKLGETISFHNLDTADYMWHTITRCELPCTGPTRVDYPNPTAGELHFALLGQGGIDETMLPFSLSATDAIVPMPMVNRLSSIKIDPMDFDSTQLGVGTGPTQKLTWTFQPTEVGTYTFYCRVHPPMRGVFRVDPA